MSFRSPDPSRLPVPRTPLIYEEMGILRSLIWKFSGQKKRLRFTLERNVDMEDGSSRKISIHNTTIKMSPNSKKMQ
ncbi:MAG: hypothetical protein WBA22_12340 [Candidatus Methanofastidiosia archaeon]